MGPCVVNVFKQNQQDAMLHNGIYFISVVKGSRALLPLTTIILICQILYISNLLYYIIKARKCPMLCIQF